MEPLYALTLTRIDLARASQGIQANAGRRSCRPMRSHRPWRHLLAKAGRALAGAWRLATVQGRPPLAGPGVAGAERH